MLLLKDLKLALYIDETVNVYDKNGRFASVIVFYGKAKDIPQKFDDCIVYNIFINTNEELSICIKKVVKNT